MDHIIDVSFLGDCTYMRRVCLLTSRFLVSEFPGFLGSFEALFYFCQEKYGTEYNQCWGSLGSFSEFEWIVAFRGLAALILITTIVDLCRPFSRKRPVERFNSC